MPTAIEPLSNLALIFNCPLQGLIIEIYSSMSSGRNPDAILSHNAAEYPAPPQYTKANWIASYLGKK